MSDKTKNSITKQLNSITFKKLGGLLLHRCFQSNKTLKSNKNIKKYNYENRRKN